MRLRRCVAKPIVLPPRARRVIAAVTSLQPMAAAMLAAQTGLTVRETLHRLWNLRVAGAAKLVSLWNPSLAGRPVQNLVDVRLQLTVPGALRTFEAYCLDERAITAAVVLAGKADYALWTAHPDARTARDWLRQLVLRAEVAAVDAKGVTVRFGHLLQGAPVYAAVANRPNSATD